MQTPSEEWTQDLTRYFKKEDIQIAKKASEQAPNIISYPENVKQNHNEILLHTHYND